MNEKNDVKYFPVAVKSYTRTDVVREGDTNDRWDKDDLSHDTEYHYVYPDENNRNHLELAVPFKLVDGNQYWLVVVTYSTGDSFHHEDGCTQEIGLYKTWKKANAAVEEINHHYSFCDRGRPWNSKVKNKKPKGWDAFSISIFNEVGRKEVVSPCWMGYFESIQAVEAISLFAKGNSK